MPSDGVGPEYPTPISRYNLSACTEPTTLIPATGITVVDITVCGIVYALNTTYATQQSFLDELNWVFRQSVGLLGEFRIELDQLIYVTDEECTGVNCVTIDNTMRITEEYEERITEDDDTRQIE